MMVKPLERIFDLVGARVLSWYEEMPKSKKVVRGSIADHFESDRCIACKAPNTKGRESPFPLFNVPSLRPLNRFLSSLRSLLEM